MCHTHIIVHSGMRSSDGSYSGSHGCHGGHSGHWCHSVTHTRMAKSSHSITHTRMAKPSHSITQPGMAESSHSVTGDHTGFRHGYSDADESYDL
jgi:hypothetical protein